MELAAGACSTQSADLVFVAVALLLLLFPDGRLPSRRWRWVPPALVVCAAVDHRVRRRRPDAVPGAAAGPAAPVAAAARLGRGAELVAFVGLLAPGTWPARRRWWSASGGSDRRERQQIKWLALAGLGVPLYPLVLPGRDPAWGRPLWVSAAIGIAGARRHPGRDRRRDAAPRPLRRRQGARGHGHLGLVTRRPGRRSTRSTSPVGRRAAGPRLRRRGGRRARRSAPSRSPRCGAGCSGVVDRRLYPLRRAALAAIDALQRDVSAGTARPKQLESRLRVGAARPGAAGRLPGAGRRRVRRRRRRRSRPGRRRRRSCSASSQIGVLVAGSATRRPSCCARSPRPCTTLVEVVRLRLEVAEALREVESSRARLVQVGYASAAGSRRDLHDGAQQRLVSLGMALRLAQRHLDDGTVDVDGLLDQSVAELGTAVAELRQIAHGLRPEQPRRRAAAALAELVRTGAAHRRAGRRRRPAARRRRDHGVLRGQRGDHQRGQARGGRPDRAAGRAADGTSRSGSPTTAAAARALRRRLRPRRPGRGARRHAARAQPARPRDRRSRRCCHAHRDRRGLGAVPRGPGPPARRRRPRDRRPRPTTRPPSSRTVGRAAAGPRRHRHPDAARPHRRRRPRRPRLREPAARAGHRAALPARRDPALGRAGHAGGASATCSRTASSTSTTSSTPCAASPPAARRSTPRWSPRLLASAARDDPLAPLTPASARCWR